MKIPSTSEQLASAIERLVASYMDEVRLSAQQAVERSLGRSTVPQRGPSKARGPRQAPPKAAGTRRTAAELDEICEDLCKRVRARPGESIVTLADEMGVAATRLQRPMAKLRADGRVRTVGERHLTRYFPAVGKASGKE
jgi:hypothetical protein